MQKENKRTARNGVCVYSYKNPNVNSFYLSLFLRAGSMYEDESNRGMTHFLEHALIRNVNAVEGGKMYSLLDASGIEFNASTYSEMVQFYVTGATKNFATASALLLKLFSPIVLTSNEIRAERDRIRAEIRESDDRTSLSSFSSATVHSGSTLSHSILGTLSDISRVNAKRLEEYRKRAFTSENVFFYATGNYSDEDMDTFVSELGNIVLKAGEKRSNVAPVSQNFGKRVPKVYIKNADYTMLRFTFDMDMSELRFGVDDLLYDILLGGYSSRFFTELCVKRGLVYDLSGAVEKYRNIGSFFFTFEVKRGLVYEAVSLVLDILTELKNTLLSSSACMKAGYVDNGKMLIDDARETNFTFAYDNHIMNAGYSSVEERSMLYECITPEMIREAARAIFRPENMTLTMKGDKNKIDISRLENILAAFK